MLSDTLACVVYGNNAETHENRGNKPVSAGRHRGNRDRFGVIFFFFSFKSTDTDCLEFDKVVVVVVVVVVSRRRRDDVNFFARVRIQLKLVLAIQQAGETK